MAIITPLAKAEAPAPWAVERWANLPDWLKISGETRARYETLDHVFRPGASGSDQAWVFRNRFRADATLKPVSLTVELMDSRQALMDSGSPIGADDVNSLDLLQAYGLWKSGSKTDDHKKSSLQIKVGRQTLDLGSRRLIASNNFRNTINTFTGVHSEWSPSSKWRVQAFAFAPVERQPSDAASLLDNEIHWDRERFSSPFLGLSASHREGPWKTTTEGYVLGLMEHDSDRYSTRNRQLATTGLRWYRSQAVGELDFEVEGILQTGTSRATASSSDRRDLNHFAYLFHLQSGYTVDLKWRPRVAFHYDEASGDNDPGDNSMGRFDTLYGARRWELGPTGILGAFARGNFRSPGLRLNIKPLKNLSAMASYRYYWLAEERDAWTATGWRDSSGSSGRDIGSQLEWALTWSPVSSSLRIQTGGAQHWFGSFLQNVDPSISNQIYYQFFQVSANF